MKSKLHNILAVAAATATLVIGRITAAHASESANLITIDSGQAIAPDNSNITVGEEANTGADITPLAVKSVGGGTWNYGSRLGLVPPKTCWSNYKHNTKYHSSTAILASSNVTGYANARSWSYAKTGAGAAYTCYTYWNTC